MAKRTRITTILFAALVLLCLVGVILVVVGSLSALSSFLILFPLACNIVLMIVYIIVIGCLASGKKLSKNNRDKQAYVHLSQSCSPRTHTRW